MTRKVADSIRRGLEEAVAYAAGTADARRYGVHVPADIDVKAIYTELDMTQEDFAGRFGFTQAMWTLSSASRMMLEATTPTAIRANAMRLVIAGETSRCSKTILRPQATWATIAIGPTQ